MNQNDIATPTRTAQILKQFDLRAKKSLGQNFIVDTNILDNIVEAGQVDKRTVVIEIGPGIGALTEQIAKKAQHVYAFEIDQRLIPVLGHTLDSYDNITIVNEDILAVDLDKFSQEYLKDAERIVVMANLPYYITTPIIINFLESHLAIDEMIFMIQKEVANRISAEPSTKAYGSLSIAVQYYATAKVEFIVPRTVFKPQPNVDSAIIKLTARQYPAVEVSDEAYFFKLARASFAQRRKTLWNNLKIAFGKDKVIQDTVKDALLAADIDSRRRGETLSLEEFAALTNELTKREVQFLDK